MRSSPPTSPPHALVSIHDVSPGSLPVVGTILAGLQSVGVTAVTLLVIPGCDWSPDDLSRLKMLQRHGVRLAGHGWHHRSVASMTAGHRLHSLLLSRRAAEHLSRPSAQLLTMVNRSYAWFERAGLSAPHLYVPPAWAMGHLPRRALRQLPYRYFETLAGVYDAGRDLFHGLPLMGFEADTRLRVSFLQVFNRLNYLLANRLNRPLRIAIHPQDFQLGLAESLQSYLRQFTSFRDYTDLGC